MDQQCSPSLWIVRFINEQHDGWEKPQYGIPLGSVILELHDVSGSCGSFGVGSDFFEAERGSSFWVQHTTARERNKLLRLVGQLPSNLQEVVLPEISGITRVIAKTNKSKAPSVISVPEKVREIVNFVNGNRKGWDKPWVGQPLPTVKLELEDKNGCVVEFGIGDGYFETADNEIGIRSRSKAATEKQTQAVLRLLGLP